MTAAMDVLDSLGFNLRAFAMNVAVLVLPAALALAALILVMKRAARR